jgi:hypothetical protein
LKFASSDHAVPRHPLIVRFLYHLRSLRATMSQKSSANLSPRLQPRQWRGLIKPPKTTPLELFARGSSNAHRRSTPPTLG